MASDNNPNDPESTFPVPEPHDRGTLEGDEKPNSFPIVGIGASAGGLDAYQQLLSHLPSDTGMAFVLVQHLDPRHESRLGDLLTRHTRMPIIEASEGMEVEPNRVYIIPPNSNLAIEGGVLHVTPRPEGRGPHLPIDYFFRTLAEDQRSYAVGIILSGTGSDGAQGLCEIKAMGGLSFVQNEESARYSGMPRSALESGCADLILPPDEIARRLAQLRSHPYLVRHGEPGEAPEENADSLYRRILTRVRTVTGVDFSQYRDTTIKRRIMRRMALHTQESLGDYAGRLDKDPPEVKSLYHDLLINVTSFFRDPKLFDGLKQQVYPEIMKSKRPMTPLRVWVPGCSSGQEAYSIAMSLIEFFDDKPSRPPIQIFATDISDPVSLEKARAGVYPDNIEVELTPERLRRFFQKEDSFYRIEKSIRDLCVFARQNLTSDPPFSHVDLISCRNVLIYLATPLQRRVLPTFHYALNNPGFLVLGTSETVGENTDLFDLVDRANKIYSKKPNASRPYVHFAVDDYRGGNELTARRPSAPAASANDFQREADRVLLGRYAPPGVLVNENLDIIQFRGRTSAYLEAPSGEPTSNLLKMAREGLFLELRSALTEAAAQNGPVRRNGLRVRSNGGVHTVDVEVIPVRPSGLRENCFLVLFAEPVEAEPAPPTPEPTKEESELQDAKEREILQLRRELTASKEYLQSLLEQQDAANEELRSANEEILSSNEELQSTNEELETAKEELQSTNEELTTVNEQLQNRNVELNQLNNDLSNLLSSTALPVVMVGPDLRIRRFTQAARRAMNLLANDIGRPIGDLKTNIDVGDLDEMIHDVIDHVQVREREVRDRDGRWHTLRIHPYRTSDHKIEGAVILLIDIDDLKKSAEAQKQTETVLAERLEQLRDVDRHRTEFLALLAHELRTPLAPISNAAEILRPFGSQDPKIAASTGLIDREVQHMARMLEDLLDLSRVTRDRLVLHLEPVKLADVVREAVETSRSFASAKEHQVRVGLPAEDLWVHGDATRLCQVLANLLINAAKYTQPRGLIEVSLQADRAMAAIRIKDNGVGIPEELLGHIFDMFTQGENGQSGNQGGLGIGLTLVKSLVALHGGTIEANSEGLGKGSEFILRLPLTSERPKAQPHAAQPLPSTGAKRILVVDDDEIQMTSLGVLLESLGNEIRTANDGASALKALSTFVPDFALIDLSLPQGMSGYDLARAIRADNRLARTILIAQTGWGRDEDRERARLAGFDFHLVKPLDHARLQRIITGVEKP